MYVFFLIHRLMADDGLEAQKDISYEVRRILIIFYAIEYIIYILTQKLHFRWIFFKGISM